MSAVAAGGVKVPSVACSMSPGTSPGAQHERVARGEVGVHAGQRAEPLGRPQLRFRQAGDVGRLEAVLRGLLEKQTALDERAASLEGRLPPGDSRDLEQREALQSKRRLEVVDMNLPLVLALVWSRCSTRPEENRPNSTS